MGKKPITTFKDLSAWKEGHKLVLLTYITTKGLPKDELFGLTSQMRRAATSITSNTAEGFSRRGPSEKARFYSMALGSLTELQNQILIAKDVGYMELADFDVLNSQTVLVHKLLNGLIKSTRQLAEDLNS
jgi:four helix bundle protein